MSSPPESEIEWLHIVDACDRPVGIASRDDVHRLKLCHRSVHILIFNRRHEVLLQRRAAHKTVNPGLWDSSAAGHVEAGESYEMAAKRELSEELGLSDSTLEPLFTLPPEDETGREWIHLFRGHCEDSARLKPDFQEISALQWQAANDMDLRVSREDPELTRTLRKIWHRLMKNR